RNPVALGGAELDGPVAAIAVGDLDRMGRGIDARHPGRVRQVPELQRREAVAAADVDHRAAGHVSRVEDEVAVAGEDVPAGELVAGGVDVADAARGVRVERVYSLTCAHAPLPTLPPMGGGGFSLPPRKGCPAGISAA